VSALVNLGSNPTGKNFDSRFWLHLCPLANSKLQSLEWSQWEDQAARERAGHPPSQAEVKKMKSPTLHVQGYLSEIA
jgi:hypothetical protein